MFLLVEPASFDDLLDDVLLGRLLPKDPAESEVVGQSEDDEEDEEDDSGLTERDQEEQEAERREGRERACQLVKERKELKENVVAVEEIGKKKLDATHH